MAIHFYDQGPKGRRGKSSTLTYGVNIWFQQIIVSVRRDKVKNSVWRSSGWLTDLSRLPLRSSQLLNWTSEQERYLGLTPLLRTLHMQSTCFYFSRIKWLMIPCSCFRAFTGWQDSRNDASKAVVYGDGSPLDPVILRRCLDVMNEICCSFEWKQGDLILIDNVVTMHSRNSFEGSRRIYASLWK